jgi:FkbM family methyltransferase
MLNSKLKKFLNFNNGFFIEVGAHDGIFQSNTLYLEKNNDWTGFLIEPSFEVYLNCVKNRPNSKCFNLALTSEEYFKKKKIINGDFDGSPMSGVMTFRSGFSIKENILNLFQSFKKNKIKSVNSIPLQLLIDLFNIKKIDFLSLDVEGYEYEVLKGINFDISRPRFILIEVRDIQKNKIFNLLERANYIFLENISQYNKKDYPKWDGTHQDYIFQAR